MNYTATITSKRQFTIPAKLFNKVGFKVNQKVLVKEQDGRVLIEPATALVERLAGSVKVPKRFRDLGTEEIIKKARKEYFSSRYK